MSNTTFLYKIWIPAFLLCVVAFACAIYFNGDPSGSNGCLIQEKNRLSDLEKLKLDLKNAQKRKSLFESALTDITHPGFKIARSEIAFEEKEIKKFRAKIIGLEIPKVKSSLYGPISLLVVGISLGVFLTYILLKDFPYVLNVEKTKISNFFWPYIITVVILTLINITETTVTSVLPEANKTWFSWESYCQSPLSFIFIRFVLLGYFMILSVPVAIFTCATRKQKIPEIDLSSTDGTCGVGGYIEKLQKWTSIGPIVIFVPIVFWIRFVISQQGGLSFGYLISAVFTGVLLMVLIGRVIRNVMIIRMDYSRNYQDSGKNFEEIAQKIIPPDPTLVFISTEWWKLPTIIYPVITSIWFFVELSGIAPYLTKAVQ